MNTKYSNNVTTFAYSFSTNLLYASNMRTNYRKDTAMQFAHANLWL